MTLEQRVKTKAALGRYGMHVRRSDRVSLAWQDAIEEALEYYDHHDPLRSELVRIRYFQHQTEEKTLERLNLGRTTYQKAHDDFLSTVAVNAARRGALDASAGSAKPGQPAMAAPQQIK